MNQCCEKIYVQNLKILFANILLYLTTKLVIFYDATIVDSHTE